jgi:hypothetical protein
MADNKNTIIVYRDWITTFESLTDEEAGKLIKHFFRYINDKNPDSPDRLTSLLFEPIKQSLKRDLKRYKAMCLKNSNNVKIRWNKKDTTVYDRIPTDTKHTDIDTDNDTDTDKEKNIIPPPVFLIAKYCKERNNGIDPEYFYDWYQTRGWKVGKDKMKDWQSAIRTWESRNKKKSEPKLIMP